MYAFLDFEASSLGRHSYPIEVAWVFEDGRCEEHLIRPAPGWTDWDDAAQAIHGIPRATLEAVGEPHDRVAGQLLEALQGHDVFVTAPSWDGKWLSVLFRASGIDRHALRLRDTEEAHYEAVSRRLRGMIPFPEVGPEIARVLEAVRSHGDAQPVRHRALSDAQAELESWQLAVRLAAEAECAWRQSGSVIAGVTTGLAADPRTPAAFSAPRRGVPERS